MKYKVHKVLTIVLCIVILFGSFQISETEVHAAGGNLSSLINIQGAQGYLWIPENITSDTGFVWCMPGNGNGGTYEYFTGGTACTKHVVFFVKYQDNQGNEWCSLYTKVPDIINELKSTYNLSGMSDKLYYYGYSQGSWRFGWNSNYTGGSSTYGFSSLNIWDEAILNDGGSANAINVGRLSRVYVVQGGAERHKAEYDTKFGSLGSNYTIFDDSTMKHYPTDPNRPGPLNAKDYGMLTIGLDWFGGNTHGPTPTPSPDNPTPTTDPDNPTTTPTPTSGDTPTGYSGLGGYGVYYNYYDKADDTGSNYSSTTPTPGGPTPTPEGPTQGDPTPTPGGPTPPPWAGDYPSGEQVDTYLTSIGIGGTKKNSLVTCYEQGVERGWPLPEICGLMANVNAEGQSGVIEYAFSQYNYFGFGNPSGKTIITTGADIEYLLSWPGSHPEGTDNHVYNGKGPYTTKDGYSYQYDSCGVGWIGYSFGARHTYCNTLKDNMSGTNPTADELEATDIQMLYDYWFVNKYPGVHTACASLNAYECGYKQCVEAIRPKNKEAAGVTRGTQAQEFYDALNSL